MINFKPRRSPNEYFTGSVWIDSISQNILKVNLKADHTDVNPFQPYWEHDDHVEVDFDITKNFEINDGHSYLRSVDFNYRVFYEDRIGEDFQVQTNAILYAYNFDELFQLPYFEYSQSHGEDYRKISATPYNTDFWRLQKEFKMGDINSRNEKFVSDPGTLGYDEIFRGGSDFEYGFYESPYMPWNAKRIHFKEVIADTLTTEASKLQFTKDRYNISVQLFLDVNIFGDSIYHLTQSILDPFQSYYRLEKTLESDAFINMYFDLVELGRRDLEKELTQPDLTISTIDSIYRKHQALTLDMTTQFLDEVVRGTEQKSMEKWNDLILEKLGINNIEFFGLYQEVESEE